MSNDETRKGVVNRLKTIKGHIAGVERMVEEGKSCDDILLQIAAIKASVHKVGLVIMENHLMDCMVSENGDIDRKEFEKILKTVVKYAK